MLYILYTDDSILLSSKQNLIYETIENLIKCELKITVIETIDEFLGVQFKQKGINDDARKTVEKNYQKDKTHTMNSGHEKAIHSSISSKEHISGTNDKPTDPNRNNSDNPHEDAHQSPYNTFPTGIQNANISQSVIEEHKYTDPLNPSIYNALQPSQDMYPTSNHGTNSNHSTIDTRKPSRITNPSIDQNIQSDRTIDDAHHPTIKDHPSINQVDAKYTRAMTKQIMTRVEASQMRSTMVMTQPYLITQIIREVGLKNDSNIKAIPCKESTILTRGENEKPFDRAFEYRRVIGMLAYLEK